ncbi:hypothetical protein EST38_g5563 [Candolleomyces aberdarensis]|uniref:DUF6532 domain-containing protein n=1 Tax=Candolleomyces aberdarensis TaxID=2316362 RepID=A0A4Q2DM79_9AGAR|nr:hypothetical protein EST38_g5563 [Candolleomyces aberdarensis]
MRELRNRKTQGALSGSSNSSKQGQNGGAAIAPAKLPSSKKRPRTNSQTESVQPLNKKKTRQAAKSHQRVQSQQLPPSKSEKRNRNTHIEANQGRDESEELDSDNEEQDELEIQPGEDEEDYEGVDLLNSFERPEWPQDNSRKNHKKSAGQSSASKQPHGQQEDDEMEARISDVEGSGNGQKSSLTARQRKRQADEQLEWLNHRRSSSTSSQIPSEDESAHHPQSSDNNTEEPSSYSGDPDSVDIILPRGSQHPLLKQQSPRVARVLRRAFAVAEYRIAFRTPYPPLDDLARYFRDVLRAGAREVDDDELAHQIKTDAVYGNRLARLVKPRFNQYRRDIRLHAKGEAKAAYRLNSDPDCAERVNKLLLSDTFVYGIDHRGVAKNTEPYRHPAIIGMIQFFFKDSRAVGRSRSQNFVSSFTEEEDMTRSAEKEIPIAMLAFSAAMLRSELLLWKLGSRQTVKFDADQHSTTYDHHVSALGELKQRFPVKFHRLMHFLHTQASSTLTPASDGCEGGGVLSQLGWEDDSE